MNFLDQIHVVSAIAKLAAGEPLSTSDAQRIIDVLRRPIVIDGPNQDQVQGLYGQLRQVLRGVYFSNDG